MPVCLNDITAVIIAGGQSSRMDYIPKYTLEIDGVSFLDRILGELSAFAKRAVSVDRIRQDIPGNIIQWPDEISGQGPLRALATVLSRAETEYCLVVPCDMPFVSRDYFSGLISFMEPEYDCVVAAQPRGQWSPLLGIYSKSALAVLRSELDAGLFKTKKAVSLLNMKVFPVPEGMENMLVNINTPQEFSGAVHRL